MNLEHIKNLYRLLGHEGYLSRVGFLDCQTKEYKEEYLDGLEAILERIRIMDGKRNCFISRAPINRDRSFLPARVCSFDLDPVRSPGEASTDEQHEAAITAGRRVLQRFNGGMLASSGNGALLIYPLPSPLSNVEQERSDYYRKEGAFIEAVLQPLVQDLNIKVDKTNYEKAIIKLIGTQSTKGDSRHHRLSRFLVYPNAVDKGMDICDAIRQLPAHPPQSSVKQWEGDPIKRLKEAKEALDSLNGPYHNDYDKWLKVGMALKEFGISGLSLWRDWSRKSEKYEEGVCEKKWETLKEVPEVTLGSLRYWAEGSRTTQGDSKSISVSYDNYFSGLFSPHSDLEKPILTGIGSLDSVLRALPKGEITTIAARSGFGKSSFCVSVVENLRRQGKSCLYFSTEMSTQYIMHKFVSIATGIPTQKLIEKVISEEDTKRIRAYEQELLRSPLIICDEFSPKIELVKDLVEQHKPDVVVFDHATQSGTHWEYVAQFLRDLKELTATNGLVTLLASQLNEPPRGSNGVVGSSVRGDVRGTQEVIFLSAIFMMMNNIYEVKTDIQPVELEIAKNRFGISGLKLEVHVNKQTGKFSE